MAVCRVVLRGAADGRRECLAKCQSRSKAKKPVITILYSERRVCLEAGEPSGGLAVVVDCVLEDILKGVVVGMRNGIMGMGMRRGLVDGGLW